MLVYCWLVWVVWCCFGFRLCLQAAYFCLLVFSLVGGCVNSVVVICFLYCCDLLRLIVVVSIVYRLFWVLLVVWISLLVVYLLAIVYFGVVVHVLLWLRSGYCLGLTVFLLFCA